MIEFFPIFLWDVLHVYTIFKIFGLKEWYNIFKRFKKLKILSTSPAMCHVVHALYVCSECFLKKNSKFKEFKVLSSMCLQ